MRKMAVLLIFSKEEGTERVCESNELYNIYRRVNKNQQAPIFMNRDELNDEESQQVLHTHFQCFRSRGLAIALAIVIKEGFPQYRRQRCPWPCTYA